MKVKEKTNVNSHVFTFSNKLIRVIWGICWLLFFRLSPLPFFELRNFILRLFGASIGKGVRIYPSVRVWLPMNLRVGNFSSVGPGVNIYNQGDVCIDNKVIISQRTHLCASTHDYTNLLHPLVLAPITIRDNVWVCAEAFIGPNVTLAKGCVIGARSVVTKDTNEYEVYAGNPANSVNQRNIKMSDGHDDINLRQEK
jgi:putative colanic acid biosynthesis acetyltransferase WcaF